MSYRNPQQVVDTQTGQHYRNLQASISNTFNKVADASMKEQARLRIEKEKTQLRLDREAEKSKKEAIEIMRRDVNASAEINKILNGAAVSLEHAGPLTAEITRYATLLTKGVTNTNETIFIKNMASLPDDMLAATALVNSFISASEDDLGKNIGKMGGASLTNTQEARNFALVLSNNKKGTSYFSTDSTGADGNVIKFTVTPEDGEPISYTYAQLKALQQGGGSIIQKIPDVTPEYERSFKDANILNKKGVIEESFLGELGPRERDPRNPDRLLRFRKVDAQKVKDALRPDARITIGTLSETNPNAEVNLYNFYARRQNARAAEGDEKLDILDYGTPLTKGKDSQTELLENMYVDHQYEREAVNFQPVLGSTEKRSSNEPEPTKITPQEQAQEQALEFVKMFINNPVAIAENSGITVLDFDKQTQTITVPDGDGGKTVLDLTKDSGIRKLISEVDKKGIKGATLTEMKKLLLKKNLYSEYNTSGPKGGQASGGAAPLTNTDGNLFIDQFVVPGSYDNI